MADEPIAIRHPKRGKAHRRYRRGHVRTRCGLRADDMTERVPLSQVAPEDRCRTCWPTSEEAGL